MSGHSKWSTIKRKKELTDGARAKVFTKMGREISIAVREGGADPASNFKLAMIISKAKAANVPNDNIERAIKRAAGGGDKEQYEVITYEGYGPAGVAFMVQTMTDNRNRTAGDLRHFFDKFGGNLGQSGCVSFMFDRKGVIDIEPEGVSEEKLMEDALEAGAEDFTFDEDGLTVYCPFDAVDGTAQFLRDRGYDVISSEPAYIPSTYTEVTDPEACEKLDKLIEALESCDDVSDFWNNLK